MHGGVCSRLLSIWLHSSLGENRRLITARARFESVGNHQKGKCMDKKTMDKADAILARGDRVELIPVKDGVKVIQVQRKEIK